MSSTSATQVSSSASATKTPDSQSGDDESTKILVNTGATSASPSKNTRAQSKGLGDGIRLSQISRSLKERGHGVLPESAGHGVLPESAPAPSHPLPESAPAPSSPPPPPGNLKARNLAPPDSHAYQVKINHVYFVFTVILYQPCLFLSTMSILFLQ